jgi:hypothetical protein
MLFFLEFELEIMNLSVSCLPKFIILSSAKKPDNQNDDPSENEKRDPDCEEITERKRPAVQNQRKNDFRCRSIPPITASAWCRNASPLKAAGDEKVTVRTEKVVRNSSEFRGSFTDGQIESFGINGQFPGLLGLTKKHVITSNQKVALEVIERPVGIRNADMTDRRDEPGKNRN